MVAQEVPRVDSGFVAVVPGEVESVVSHWRDGVGARRGLIHGQEGWFFVRRLADGAAGLLALGVAGGAGAGVAQPGEAPCAAMAVFPIDFEAGAFTLMHAHLDGLALFGGQLAFLARFALKLFFGDESNAFVAHAGFIFSQTGLKREMGA